MMSTNILFITSNSAKVKLANAQLKPFNISLIQKDLDLKELRSQDVEEVSLDKAKQVIERGETNPFIVEDTAAEIPALNNFPSTYVKLAFDVLGEAKIAQLMSGEPDKSIIMRSVLTYVDPRAKTIKSFEGTYKGTISTVPRGNKDRGWRLTRLFIPPFTNKTLAEINDEEWNLFLSSYTENDHFVKFAKWYSGLR